MSGADYAEMFEWADNNPTNEDRIGYFVTLEKNKIRKATNSDSYILGIIAGTSSMVSNVYDDTWCDMYLKDKWNRVQYETIQTKETIMVLEDNKPVEKEIIREQQMPKINPLYDESKPYVSRLKRSEWAAVGLLGQLLIKDDGTCIENGYCHPNDDGIATNSETGYRVLMRTDVDQVLILFK